MKFDRLVAPSLKELFVYQIRDAILSGRLPVGSQLPTERSLAEQMQVSRAVVNSGFVELEKQGFLEIRPRQGVFVTDYRKNGNINTLTAIMEYHDGSLGPGEIRSILDVRRGLEYIVESGVIKNATPQEINGLSALLSAMENTDQIEDMVTLAFNFHHNLSLMSGNSIMPLLYVSFKPVVTQLWRRFCSKYGCRALYDSTVELYDAIRMRDEEGARRCTNRRLDDAICGQHQLI